MPPKRPQSHINADKSIVKMTEAFLSVGWSVEELDKDYGEDLLVRLFNNEEATQYTFFVQAKSCKNTTKLMTDDGHYIQYTVDLSHLKYWKDFWEPVIVAVWDSRGDVIYWEIIQSPERPIDSSDRRARLYIPTDNTLDASGLMRIAARTISRHERFEQEQYGAQVLIDLLEEALGVEIEYDPQTGWLIISKPSGEVQVTAFGKAMEMIKKTEKLTGLSADDVVNRSIIKSAEIAELLDRPGSALVLQNAEGETIAEWESFYDLMRHIEREKELEEP